MQAGYFTGSDRITISKAALLAERLTQQHFDMGENEWKHHPYGMYTRREVDHSLHEAEAFAHVVMFKSSTDARQKGNQAEKYGIVLQDPNILLALLRSSLHDLWTLGLFVLTHELVHIVRFRKFGVDFFAGVHDRDREEEHVQAITRDILSGVTNTDYLLDLYNKQTNKVARKPRNVGDYGGC